MSLTSVCPHCNELNFNGLWTKTVTCSNCNSTYNVNKMKPVKFKKEA